VRKLPHGCGGVLGKGEITGRGERTGFFLNRSNSMKRRNMFGEDFCGSFLVGVTNKGRGRKEVTERQGSVQGRGIGSGIGSPFHGARGCEQCKGEELLPRGLEG